MNMQKGILRDGDSKDKGQQGAPGVGSKYEGESWPDCPTPNNVLCYLFRDALTLDLTKAQRIKGINSQQHWGMRLAPSEAGFRRVTGPVASPSRANRS